MKYNAVTVTQLNKYLKDKYQIDLEAIANGPEDWDLPLPPIPETPDEE